MAEKDKFRWQLSLNPECLLILAHGAGTDMDHSFLQELSNHFAAKAHVLRFNFPYILQGRKSPASPKPAIASVGEMIQLAAETYPNLPIFLSGKSYGGRMASHWLAENPDSIVRGIIYYGFPLHAPDKEGISRADHLSSIQQPQLFMQGTNDLLANFELIQQITASLKQATLEVFTHADHSFKVPKKLGGNEREMKERLFQKSHQWIKRILNS